MWSTQGQWVASEVHHTPLAMHTPSGLIASRGTYSFRSVSCSWWLKAVRKQESGHLWEDRENSTLLMRNITYDDPIGVKENGESKHMSRVPLMHVFWFTHVYMLGDSEVSLDEQHTIDDNQWHDVSIWKSLSSTYKRSCSHWQRPSGRNVLPIGYHHFTCQVTFCYRYQRNHVPLQHHAGWCYNCWQDSMWRAVWKCQCKMYTICLSLILTIAPLSVSLALVTPQRTWPAWCQRTRCRFWGRSILGGPRYRTWGRTSGDGGKEEGGDKLENMDMNPWCDDVMIGMDARMNCFFLLIVHIVDIIATCMAKDSLNIFWWFVTATWRYTAIEGRVEMKRSHMLRIQCTAIPTRTEHRGQGNVKRNLHWSSGIKIALAKLECNRGNTRSDNFATAVVIQLCYGEDGPHLFITPDLHAHCHFDLQL